MKTAYTTTDWLYCLTLGLTLAASGSMTVMLLGEGEAVAFFAATETATVLAGLGACLTPMAAGLLVWRVWLAWRYQAVPPCGDACLPTVTVVIPAYNEGRQVLETVRSVMASDYPPAKLQIICVDDGSKDDTWLWMRTAAREFPKRLSLVRQPRNMGKRHALLAGFRLATGEAFVTIDSDSLIMPDTLRHLVSPLAVSPRVGAVAGNVRVLNLHEGPIPKMLDVSFVMSFDFLRRGQGAFGGVFCTPGALSAYRRESLAPVIDAWAAQTFMGRPAAIGEDRALSNIILERGLRVVYQKDAVVLTTIPTNYRGLYKMLLRWARSNVRECLVMTRFLFRRFRAGDSGAGWVRFSGLLELLFLPLTEIFKVACIVGLFLHPQATLWAMLAGCVTMAALPALIYQFKRPGLFGIVWSTAYAFFWVFGLSWITLWGLCSAGCSGWLTRGLATAPRPLTPQDNPGPA